MNKYDSMIACNKKASEEKVNRAVTEIRQMLTEREKVTVPKLTKRTGLSRGFFYKNETVRKEMDRALEQQAGMIDPKTKKYMFKNLIWNEKVWTGDLCKTVECCTGTRRSRVNALRIIVNTIHSCL